MLIQNLLYYNTLLADSSWLAAWRASEAGDCNSRRRIASADAATCLPKGVVGTYDTVLAGLRYGFASADFWLCKGLSSAYTLLVVLTGAMRPASSS